MKLDIPFTKSRGFECGQTCVSMAIKYYFPEFEPNFDEFNKIARHTPGFYTFPSQNALILDHYKVKCKFYDSQGLATSKEDPEIF